MDSTVYQIAEHLPSDPWLVENTMLTSSWHDSFHDKLKDHIFSSLASSSAMHQIIGLHEYSNNGTPYSNRTQAVKYMVSHDEQSLIQEMVAFHGEPLSNAREIDKFYATLLFTAQGIPMIWQGQEIGFQSGWLDDNGNGNWDEEKLGYRPMDWSLLNTEEGQSHLDYYSKLAKLRTENPAFSKGTFYELENYTTERVIVYGYKDESSNNNNDQVIVIANFSSLERTIQNIPFLSTGNWYNVFEPENDIFLENDYYPEYTMSPNSAIIFTNYEWQLTVKPEPLPKEFLTLKSFPNPFNGKIQFQLEGKIQNDGLIDIYDVMGRKVKSIGLNQNITGKTSFNWDGKSENGSQLSSGLYIVRVKTQTQLISQKILYLK
jgi:glycosidase